MFNLPAFIGLSILSIFIIAGITVGARLISGSRPRSGITSSAPSVENYTAMRHRYLLEVQRRRVLTYAEEKELFHGDV